MKQETLEEAAEKYDSKYINRLRPAFIAGARWQQERMYSEEDLKESFSMGRTGKTIEEFNIKFKKNKI